MHTYNYNKDKIAIVVEYYYNDSFIEQMHIEIREMIQKGNQHELRI
jgi:hypothetical protein